MSDMEAFLAELHKEHKRFFPEAPIVYLEELPVYIKVRIVVRRGLFIELRFNARNQKRSYALVRGGKRIAGFDNMDSWHIHPFGNPETHKRVAEPSLADTFHYFLRGA